MAGVYEIFIATPSNNTDGYYHYALLPEGVASLQGLSRDKDTRFVDYETWFVSEDYGDDETAMRMGGQALVEKWLAAFNGRLNDRKPTAVEWRATPRYQHSDSATDGKWHGWIKAQFSLHYPEATTTEAQ